MDVAHPYDKNFRLRAAKVKRDAHGLRKTKGTAWRCPLLGYL